MEAKLLHEIQTEGVPLNVKYDNRQWAKDIGARWNPEKRVWVLRMPEALKHPSAWKGPYAALFETVKGNYDTTPVPLSNGWTEFSEPLPSTPEL